ncbi:MAG: hypothetical protein K5987_08460 [Lachnospiraceae bacterium]|nr:hypothetical protein [Lachnospiraceae bacterium]
MDIIELILYTRLLIDFISNNIDFSVKYEKDPMATKAWSYRSIADNKELSKSLQDKNTKIHFLKNHKGEKNESRRKSI